MAAWAALATKKRDRYVFEAETPHPSDSGGEESPLKMKPTPSNEGEGERTLKNIPG